MHMHGVTLRACDSVHDMRRERGGGETECVDILTIVHPMFAMSAVHRHGSHHQHRQQQQQQQQH